MLHQTELERLRIQKKLLVLQSDANRLLLAADWQRVSSPETWMNEAGELARRHPVWTTALTAAAGVLAVKAVCRPGILAGGLGRLGGIGAMALSAWRMFRSKKTEP